MRPQLHACLFIVICGVTHGCIGRRAAADMVQQDRARFACHCQRGMCLAACTMVPPSARSVYICTDMDASIQVSVLQKCAGLQSKTAEDHCASKAVHIPGRNLILRAHELS